MMDSALEGKTKLACPRKRWQNSASKCHHRFLLVMLFVNLLLSVGNLPTALANNADADADSSQSRQDQDNPTGGGSSSARNINLQSSEDRAAQEQVEKIRLQREAKFEADVAKMNKDQKKAAIRQKRTDARVNKNVLKAAKNEQHYTVLGLRNWEIQIGPLQLFRFQVGPFHLFRITSKDIRQAYKKKARMVHPDKNRDGKAEEAFVAMQQSAEFLSDDNLRTEYDRDARVVQKQKRQETLQLAHEVIDTIRRAIVKIVGLFTKFLGPFAAPIIVLGVLVS